ncbi:MAG: hypothetical protein RIR96_32 [Bacteroidota bacterium]
MSRKIIIFFLLSLAFQSKAQLNNSWIDLSQPYFKFKLNKDTICRIPFSTISALGLSNVNADHFQLFRNGKEERLYTSVSGTPLASGDYIEFWGLMNDGKPDNTLYRTPELQLSDKYSLETDTSCYFLTVSSSGNHLRFQNVVNAAPSSRTPEPFFMRELDFYYKSQLNRGEARAVGEYVYSSSYDQGEGWSSPNVSPASDLVRTFSGLNLYANGPVNTFSVRVHAAGAAPNTRNLKIKVNQTEITAAPYSGAYVMSYFDQRKAEIINLPISLITNPNSVQIAVNSTSTNAFDRIVVSRIGLRYPSNFNFSGAKQFAFELEPSSNGNYLEIANFNYGSIAPILYDMTEGLRYVGEIASTPGVVKFLLPPSATAKDFILTSQSDVNLVNNAESVTFIDFDDVQNQGNYLIITHPSLFTDASGANPVEAYKQYRSTAAGGGFNPKIYNTQQLIDQFGFGIKNNPAAIRDFVRYAKQHFFQTPNYVFIIGRGLSYFDAKNNENNSATDKLNLVPSFGWPASDILLVSEPGIVSPIFPVGRLGAVNGDEVRDYLNKMIEYESAQQSSVNTISEKAWMKNVLHVAGGRDTSENNAFKAYMQGYERIIEDSAFGGWTETFTKTSTGAVQQASSQRIGELFEEGIGLIGYFGHSSANTFEFNLSNPDIYNSAGKYPFFNVSGCSAGNYYIFDPLRTSGNMTISEKYVLAPSRGSIGFLADTHFGIPPFLNIYNTALYQAMSLSMYGNTIGNQISDVIRQLGGENSNLEYFSRIHLEEINLHGDPALKINSFSKPDLAVEESSVRISPNIITVADSRFKLKVDLFNIGKAINDSVMLSIKRKKPNDSIEILYHGNFRPIKNRDSVEFTVDISPNTDKGLNQITIQLDEDLRYDESSETNNIVVKDFYIFEDELRPVYPYDFSIVNRQNITFSASTANPLSGSRDVVMEIDTTENFNSAFKKTYNQTAFGGLVEFNPSNLTFTDSMVYYWRVAMIPQNTTPVIWNTSSFAYLRGSGPGFNQSHYFQWKKSNYSDITLEDNRIFSFRQQPKNLIFRNGLFPFYDYDRVNVNLDFNQIELWGCATLWRPRDTMENNLQFYVFDTVTLATWRNRNVNASNGLFGSRQVCQNSATPTDTTRAFFEFKISDPVSRKRAMDFIDSVPDGYYIAVTHFGNNRNRTFISNWQADTSFLGSGQSLYHKLKGLGFTSVDSFTKNIPFLFFFKKNNPNFIPTQVVGLTDSSYIDQTIELNTISTEGVIESPVFGPASSWTSLHWDGKARESQITDTVKLQVWGIRNDGTSVWLGQQYPALDSSLQYVDAREFPYLKIKMNIKDSRFVTPSQLKYLRINADYVPEGAIAPSIQFNFKDSLDQGEPLVFKIAFKNISETPFDSLMAVKIKITDRNNQTQTVSLPERKLLLAGDTLLAEYRVETSDLSGNNILFIEFNPDNDQREKFHFNNVLFKNFYVRSDLYNPLLDVTFDGVHILNKDIVSGKPQIRISLKDENRFMELKDTSLISVKIRYPDQTIHNMHFGDTMRFIPANLASGVNEAKIELDPVFTEDGDYELMISGKDAAGNQTGSLEHRTAFSVITKAMISNLLNYPNPFTSSTAFVFTLTGSQIPQNIRIQILTVTGKIVKEILKDELGPIHIGRNITQYKWDGTDMYGQRLGNGVYLYRVLTNLNGKSLDKYRSQGEETDRFFNKGYGKMYLMR